VFIVKVMRFTAGSFGEYPVYIILFIRESGKVLLFRKPTSDHWKQICNILSLIVRQRRGMLRVFSTEFFFTGIPGQAFPVSETIHSVRTKFATGQLTGQCPMYLYSVSHGTAFQHPFSNDTGWVSLWAVKYNSGKIIPNTIRWNY